MVSEQIRQKLVDSRSAYTNFVESSDLCKLSALAAQKATLGNATLSQTTNFRLLETETVC